MERVPIELGQENRQGRRGGRGRTRERGANDGARRER